MHTGDSMAVCVIFRWKAQKMKNRPEAFHYAWTIMAGCILFQAACVGVMINNTGIIISAVIQDCGFSGGSLSLYYTIRMLASAFTVGYTSKLLFKYGAKRYLSLSVGLMGIAYGAMAFFDSLWQWYVSALIFGIAMSSTMMAIPCMINNWFHRKNGLVLGITMAASGVAGAIYSPICSTLIERFGWRVTVLASSGTVAAAALAAAMGILSLYPEDRGWKAYGGEERNSKERRRCAEGMGKNLSKYLDNGQAVDSDSGSSLLLLCAGCLAAGSALVQLTNYFPLYAGSIGYDLTAGAFMTSCIMMGNVCGKFVIGCLRDRLGVWRAMLCTFMAVIVSLLMLLACPAVPWVLYLASVLFGMIYGISVVMPSLVCLEAFGAGQYAGRLSVITSVNSLLGACSTVVVGNLYDRSGSFSSVFLLAIAVCVFSACCTGLMLVRSLRREKGKNKERWSYEHT